MFAVVELRVRQVKIGRKSCFGILLLPLLTFGYVPNFDPSLQMVG